MESDPIPTPLSPMDTLIASQRTFIHSMATPLAIILGMLDIVLSQPEKIKNLDVVEVTRLQKALKAAQKMEVLLKTNRTALIELKPPTPNSN